jgi:hypothetical protein
MQISCFNNVQDPNPIKDMSIDEFLDYVRGPGWKDLTDHFRSLSVEDQKQAKRTAIPCVTISGKFSYRRADGVLKHSGVACIDFDDIDPDEMEGVRANIQADKYTYACFKSISGTGLAILVKINASPEQHTEYYMNMVQYFENKYNFKSDDQCKDIARCRFVAHDPDVYRNVDALPYEPTNATLTDEQKEDLFKLGLSQQAQEKLVAQAGDPDGVRFEEKIPVSLDKYYDNIKQERNQAKDGIPQKKGIQQNEFQSIYSDKDIVSLVDYIHTNHVILGGDNYNSWLQICFAFVNEFGEAGREHFHKVSAASPAYEPTDCNKKYDNCIQTSDGKLNIGTFFFYAKQAGLRIQDFIDKNNSLIVHAATCGKDVTQGKRTIESVVKSLNMHGIMADDCEGLVRKVYERETPDPGESKIGANERAQNLLGLHYPELKKNDITRRIESEGRLLDDTFFNTIFIDLQNKDKKLNRKALEYVVDSDYTPRVNPIKEFYLKHTDAPYDPNFGEIVKLANSLHSTIGEYKEDGLDEKDETLKLDMITKWLCGIPNSVFAFHSPLVLVLTGPVGCGKTEFFRRLLPNPLNDYYNESHLDDGKDAAIALCESLLIMDDECSGKSMKETRLLKRLTSKQYFHVRSPYDKYPQELRRLAVLAATSNDDKVIFDMSGENRRILPIKISHVDIPLYNSIDKAKLAMEVYHLWKAGYNWQLLGDDITRLTKSTGDHVAENPDIGLIEKYFEDNTKQQAADVQSGAIHMSTTDIMIHIAKNTNLKMNNTPVFGKAIVKMGYKHVSNNGKKGYYMIPKRLFTDT